MLPYQLPVHGIQRLSQGHPRWKALGTLLSCRSDGMTLLLQMCMSCWATLAWRKNALSRQLPTMRKLSSSLRTSLRYTLHAVALSHTPHLSRCEISQIDDQPYSRPRDRFSMMKDGAAYCNQMTGVGWECTINLRNSCTTWKAVDKVLDPSKAMALGDLVRSDCVSTHKVLFWRRGMTGASLRRTTRWRWRCSSWRTPRGRWSMPTRP